MINSGVPPGIGPGDSLRAAAIAAIDRFFREHAEHATELVGHPILIRELKACTPSVEWRLEQKPDLHWTWRGVTLVQDEEAPNWVART